MSISSLYLFHCLSVYLYLDKNLTSCLFSLSVCLHFSFLYLAAKLFLVFRVSVLRRAALSEQPRTKAAADGLPGLTAINTGFTDGFSGVAGLADFSGFAGDFSTGCLDDVVLSGAADFEEANFCGTSG